MKGISVYHLNFRSLRRLDKKMVVTAELDSIKIREVDNIKAIKEVLEELLYVPDIRLRPKIIDELINYYDSKLGDEDHNIKIFVAYDTTELYGFVISQIHPTYTSYGRKTGTFGWLNVKNFEACKKLIIECEIFIRKHGLRKIRGNINFPKGLGGIGIQALGFEEQMMYGVAFNNPKINLIEYLERLGYKKESEYTCMKVTKGFWDSGKKIDKGIKLRHLSLEEIKDYQEEILDLGRNSFQMDFPDASGAEYRFKEMLDTYSQVPKSFYKLPDGFKPESYCNIPEILEAWDSYDLENVVTFAHMAFDRETNKLVGIILCLPDLYELWLGKPITRTNVDTAMVRKDYAGRGIFSAMNNIGQKTQNVNGITYFEGTTIWTNNIDAINSIFPHCEHIRKHYIMEKRIKSSVLNE